MRNGSNSEYFHVEGGFKLTRVRQSEWRRRWGIAAVSLFEARIASGVDDGWSNTGPDFQTGQLLATGQFTVAYNGFAWWDNVTIPAGATIQTAYIAATAKFTNLDGSGVTTTLEFEDADDAVAPTSKAEHDADVRTTASVAWDDEDFVIDAETQSPDITTVVQEIVDRGSWASGNAMMLLWDDNGSGASKLYQIYSYDDTPGKALLFHVEYTT